jgi:hypothetical protein
MEKLKLYLLKQDDNDDYNTYDSCLVAATSVDDVKTIHADGSDFKENEEWPTWALNPQSITVKLIGDASPDIKRGVIISSYNAG